MLALGNATSQHHLWDMHRRGRLPGAFLFQGPQGVGKYKVALGFASYLLLGEQKSSLTIDEDHPTIRRILAGGHGDLLRVQKNLSPEGNEPRDISIERVRQAIDFMHKTPFEGGWRIVIIDSVDEVSLQGSNALLKVIEAPPSRALFILISHTQGKVLPTLRSRCQKISFHPLTLQEMKTFFHERSLPEDHQEELCVLSEGRPGYALHLMRGEGRDTYKNLLNAFRESRTLGAAAYVPLLDIYGEPSKKSDEKIDKGAFLGPLLLTFLNRVVESVLSPTFSPLEGEKEAFQSVLARQSIDHWGELWHKTLKALDQAQRLSLNRKQVFASLFNQFE